MAAVCQPGKEPSTEPEHSGSDLRLLGFRMVKKMNFCCLSHLVSAILLWQPNHTDTFSILTFS